MEFTLYLSLPSPPPSPPPFIPLPLPPSLPPPSLPLPLPLPLSFPPSLSPLSPSSPVSIATVSEYQRFLSRLVAHKTLRIEQPFIVFLTGTIEVRKQNTVITLHSIITLNCQIRFIKHQLKIINCFAGHSQGGTLVDCQFIIIICNL